MKLSNQVLKLMYDHLVSLGHPDPLTLLARISIDTQFNADFDDGKGRTGFAGIDAKAAKAFGEIDYSSHEKALEVATVIDITNFHKVNGNLDKMLIAWRKGIRIASTRKKPLQSERRWLNKIKKAKGELAKALGLNVPEREVERETLADIELKNAYSSKAFVIDKKVDNDSLMEFFFPEAERGEKEDGILQRSAVALPVEVDHKERMIAMLIELIEVA